MRTDYSTFAGKPKQSLQILEMIRAHGDSDECLLWPYKLREGPFNYGEVQHEKKRWRVHRLAWKLVNGRIYRELLVLHSCDNPPCFNPKHLSQGTQADNLDDMDAKGRRRSNGRPGILRGPNALLQGELCANSKLTSDQVRTIRERYANGETLKEIAADTGITFGNVGHIVNRRTWKQVS